MAVLQVKFKGKERLEKGANDSTSVGGALISKGTYIGALTWATTDKLLSAPS